MVNLIFDIFVLCSSVSDDTDSDPFELNHADDSDDTTCDGKFKNYNILLFL